jgi:uncharacterized cupredoxin-like copper-binding protein
MPIRSVGAVLIAGALVVATPGGGASARTETAAGVAAASFSAAAVTPPTDETPSAPTLMARRVDIEMRDIAFLPATVEVKLGETVTFVFKNSGKLVHDAFLGDREAQDKHEEEMRNMKDPNDHHGHEGGLTVPPGQTGAMRHFFDKPGTFEIGCHQLGHYAYGMKVIIEVVPGLPSPSTAA